MNFEKYRNKLQYPKVPAMVTFSYTEQINSYREETEQLNELFKVDALDATGLTNHPNVEKIYNKAWQDCHSGGHQEVFNELSELAELILIV